MKRTTKIPVTIITGFLGAGKTTFINTLLKQNPETQFALVENEFGEVAIDTKLIKGVEASRMFELKQGCICCTITDEYELVLQELAERFPNVERLLIETTGVADPAPVVQPFLKYGDLKEIYQYNGTVCLVDAANYEAQPEEEIRFKQQVISDLILVNKSENLSEIRKIDLHKKIKSINPFARIEFVEYGNVIGLQLNNIQSAIKSKYNFITYNSPHIHIQSKFFSYQEPLNKEKFIDWMSYTLDIHKNQIYRTKGILCFQEEPFEYILQGVGGKFELEEGGFILDKTESELVFIGKLENVNLEFNP